MTRTVGKFGLRPTPHGRLLEYKFADFVDATKLPPIPDGDFGHLSLVTKPLDIYLNDQLGDCVVAGSQHETRLWVAEGTGSDSVVFDDASTVKNYELLGNYRPGDPDTDQGCDMVRAAQLRIRDGIVDATGKTHKVGIALQLQPGNWEQLQYALYLFDGVGIGILVTQEMQQAFADGKPWDVDQFNPNNAEGGHYVPGCARKNGNAVVATWGEPQELTRDLYTTPQFNTVTICYASAEKLRNGVDMEGIAWSQMRSVMQGVRAA